MEIGANVGDAMLGAIVVTGGVGAPPLLQSDGVATSIASNSAPNIAVSHPCGFANVVEQSRRPPINGDNRPNVTPRYDDDDDDNNGPLPPPPPPPPPPLPFLLRPKPPPIPNSGNDGRRRRHRRSAAAAHPPLGGRVVLVVRTGGGGGVLLVGSIRGFSEQCQPRQRSSILP